jgi:hypothetical protein
MKHGFPGTPAHQIPKSIFGLPVPTPQAGAIFQAPHATHQIALSTPSICFCAHPQPPHKQHYSPIHPPLDHSQPHASHTIHPSIPTSTTLSTAPSLGGRSGYARRYPLFPPWAVDIILDVTSGYPGCIHYIIVSAAATSTHRTPRPATYSPDR